MEYFLISLILEKIRNKLYVNNLKCDKWQLPNSPKILLHNSIKFVSQKKPLKKYAFKFSVYISKQFTASDSYYSNYR